MAIEMSGTFKLKSQTHKRLPDDDGIGLGHRETELFKCANGVGSKKETTSDISGRRWSSMSYPYVPGTWSVPSSAPAPRATEGRHPATMWIIGGILVLLFVGLLIWLLSRPSNSSSGSGTGTNDNSCNQQSSTLSTRAGRTVQIALPELSSGAGYSWQLSSFDEGFLALVSEEVLTSQPPENATVPRSVGGSNVRLFTFQALKRGKTQLVFQYGRPWETTSVESRVYQVQICEA